ncbi:MAG TPA: MotA/TolQ/ExbB proton channel family protein [Nocardioides sp.]|jgi:biopolymer transport protein ExbB/TolQ|nr:MotA/TolQ/ExbB proton channel family protein [Nocardioides sp.]
MSDRIYQAIFDVAKVLELPVVIAALIALAVVIYELGVFVMETRQRFRRRLGVLTSAADEARVAIARDDRPTAQQALARVAWSGAMSGVLARLASEAGGPGAEPRIAKELADFDFRCQRRLGYTRLLVRIGPALGLMGTLIPLSPALEGLANGDVQTLTDNLRVAFSVTVLGLLIGVVAFGLSLARDRIYGQDYSDLEYVAAVLTADSAPAATEASP